ncbi:hypothetical protein FFLO_02598 [Filobasidium floriforme]|uniref:Actin-like ATPase domain-containing protein n=1 Tax=Filobasidium floriforme TaxID=5210 RepID=A0A8K0JNU0_9TREE|nr:uncharacterized protein HD553DRAFT_368283 [Filobasidium floriforme]KAG7561958.1 hypothetical protein FFLO_02598 [Filobasidium floriforme]KAH8087457.1 hypothetical protein HD553DRAFT_368283 [Filobasidium floriforme]
MTSLRDIVEDLAQGDESELLVMSFDIGTTQSGVAMAYIAPQAQGCRVPVVMEKLNSQPAGKAKVPSTLYYDKDGKCLEEWGANDLNSAMRKAIDKGEISKSEWFKLHIDPTNASQKEAFVDRSSKQLPPGIGAIRIWGDMLEKLYRSASEIARRDWAMNWLPTLREEKKVKYVITVPVAWNRDPVIKMALRAEAIRVGLITQETGSCLCFCSESEAAALHCYDQLKMINLAVGERFLVIDAGGGTVDFTSYEITQKQPLELNEIGAENKVCLYNGSTYVDRTFSDLLKAFLAEQYPKTIPSPKHIERATRCFSENRKPGFSVSLKGRGPFPLELSDNPDDYEDGEIEVSWDLLEAAFKPHVDPIASTAAQIVATDGLKHVFCSGGFGDSPYLRETLERVVREARIIQPEQTASSSGSRAVTLGGCIFGLRPWIQQRINPSRIGCTTQRRLHPWDTIPPEDAHRITSFHGNKRMTGKFSVIVEKNQTVMAKDYHSKRLYREYEYPFPESEKAERFVLKESVGLDIPKWADDQRVKTIGSFPYTIPKDAPHGIETAPDGQQIVRYDYEVRIYCGETELRAAVFSPQGKVYGHSAYLEGAESAMDED